RRARAQAGRSIGGRGVPFARGPHCKILPGRARPAERSLAPSSGTRASARALPHRAHPAGRPRGGRARRQPPRAFGQAAGGRAHRRADRQPPRHGVATAIAVARRHHRAPRIGAAMMMRVLNICVIGALVLAAADVYKIKFESTRQAQRVAKLRLESRRARHAVAALRAEWAKLDNPARIQDLARRHLALKPVDSRQIDPLDNLPERPPDLVPVDEPDPIGTVIANPEVLDRSATGSVPTETR